ncbi:SgcJ/EcaC family oxidoreductase [Reyranella sp. CPCC 100927]|uniref:SgcJ/EcaC family oxidoreductase n=1 Tax=Reyranella sp. CPCC 100927 TaxID=2599616 RepID=UPI0011B66EC1|nr:SgcJ/EcaC family oxidoreductase [Reyranella sp. CPCC 100927]TWT02098.1 SgcJ/EcaC family oxidoreductase [Reyranella sp. CPCC 100927]
MPEDLVAIRALTQCLAEAWNRNDADAYAALFAEDCDYVAFDGSHLKGRAANARSHRALFETVLKGSRAVFEADIAVRFLTPDVAVMHGYGSILLPWQRTVAPSRRSLQTYVVKRDADRWVIHAFHNTRVRPLKLPRGWMLRLIVGFMRIRAALAGNAPPARVMP